MSVCRPAYVSTISAMSSCGQERRQYAIACAKTGRCLREFTAAADGERSADENAVCELVEWTRSHDGRAFVYLIAAEGAVPLADAQDGVGYLRVSQDSLAADSMHGAQIDDLGWVRGGAALRRSFDEPTEWGTPPEPRPPMRKVA